jgi:hypothetical protein
MDMHKITQLAEPTDATDAATKNYIDATRTRVTGFRIQTELTKRRNEFILTVAAPAGVQPNQILLCFDFCPYLQLIVRGPASIGSSGSNIPTTVQFTLVFKQLAESGLINNAPIDAFGLIHLLPRVYTVLTGNNGTISLSEQMTPRSAEPVTSVAESSLSSGATSESTTESNEVLNGYILSDDAARALI